MKIDQMRRILGKAQKLLAEDHPEVMEELQQVGEALRDMSIRIEVSVLSGIADLGFEATSNFNIFVDAVDHDAEHAGLWINCPVSELTNLEEIIQHRDGFIDEWVGNGYENG